MIVPTIPDKYKKILVDFIVRTLNKNLKRLKFCKIDMSKFIILQNKT